MTIESPFTADGEWLRCALHAHTTNSDGELSPERLALHYERAGYDVLCITDHWVRTELRQQVGRIIVIPGAELNASVGTDGRDSHVLALGLASDPLEPGANLPSLPETVAWIEANGGLPFLAHPYWSGVRTVDFVDCAGLLGVEVFNAGCELEIGRGLSATHWDEALEASRPLLGLATDDSHLPGFDSGFSSVWVRVAERSAAAVLDALRRGLFYSSTGPRIDSVEVDDDGVIVRCDPAASVALVSMRMFGAKVNAGRMGYASHGRIVAEQDGGIVEARLERWPSLPYGRVEVKDAVGSTAWTNPLWVH